MSTVERIANAEAAAGLDTLFPACVLPGCHNLVEAIGQPCNECRDIFGPMLHHNPGGVPMNADAIIARDSGTRAMYVAMYRDLTLTDDEDQGENAGEPGEERLAECWQCDATDVLCEWTSMGWECAECIGGGTE